LISGSGGHVGCCDSSPNRHARRHAFAIGHAIARRRPDEHVLHELLAHAAYLEGSFDDHRL
jgi:hypothetical protein